jgi:hypothetical protein
MPAASAAAMVTSGMSSHARAFRVAQAQRGRAREDVIAQSLR